MAVVPDLIIYDLAHDPTHPIIRPFIDKKTKVGVGASYGLSHMGYDIRLQPKWSIFRRPKLTRWEKVKQALGLSTPEEPISDIHHFDDRHLEVVEANSITLYPGEFALSVAVERFVMPADMLAIVFNKSTWARVGLNVHTTLFEPGWEGYPTIELANLSPFPIKVYAWEGIAQVVFVEATHPPITSYGDGKYQNQHSAVVTARASGKPR